jgi:hypothetical protein
MLWAVSHDCAGASSLVARSQGAGTRRLIFIPSTACYNRGPAFLTAAIQLLLVNQTLATSLANQLYCTYCTDRVGQRDHNI